MEKHYEFREKLRRIHKPNRIYDVVWTRIEGVVIDDSWTIFLPECAGIVLKNAAKDLKEYLCISMNRNVDIVSEERENQIRLQASLKEEQPAYRMSVCRNILLEGTDEKLTAQAVYALEDQMSLHEGPVVLKQDQIYRPMFSPRIVHSGLGDGLYPDEHLCAIAHAGMDAVILYTEDVSKNEELCSKINDIISRASNYGIDVYTFTPFKNRRHPSDQDAWEHYDSMYGEFFRRCPGLKGIVIVGESCEFPSQDERTTGKTWKESLQDDKVSPGWFPCRDYPEFIMLLRDVIHQVKPDAKVIFWTYNWGYVDTQLRLDLINAMPTEGITMMATYEMFEQFEPRSGVHENCVDYTISFAGPGNYFTTEAEAAAKRGIDFMTMSNTGGNTWDMGMVPYLPAPGQWIKRYEGVAKAGKKGTLSGLMESHTYGFWPSFLPELAKAAYTEPRPDMQALLRAIAVRDYGEEHADTVLKAWEHFSEGMRHCVPTNEDQYGPCRIGPAYPLFLEKWEKLPIGPESKKDPNDICCPVYRFNPDQMDKLVYEIEEYQLMLAEFEEGNRLLESVISMLPDNKKCYAEEALTVTRFVENTARTTVHVKRWHKAKIHLGIYVDHEAIWTGGRHGMPDAKSPVKELDVREDWEYWINELLSIGAAELENARDTISLVRENSRLGYTSEMDYACSEEQLLWKIRKLEATLDEEVRKLNCLKGGTIYVFCN